MKLTPEHYAILSRSLDAIRPQIDTAAKQYAAAGHSDMRFRWDCLYACKLGAWLAHDVYPYCNDAHIDTALRQYFSGRFGGAK